MRYPLIFPLILIVILAVAQATDIRQVAARSALMLEMNPDPATVANWTFDGSQDGAEFGYAVAAAGDVNGDGFADVIIGAPLYSRQTPEGVDREGAAFVFLGSSSGLGATPDWVMGSSMQGAAFGSSVAAAGDVNGDGFADVIIGAPEYKVDFGMSGEPKSGAAFVYYGSETGLSLAPDWFVLAEAAEIRLGDAVAGAGDVNGDGFDDVIVGASLFSGG
ncbi:MAG TPA: hypothetical protein DEH25_08030 [Chloroflexi bacterium]|nr:hypothetical protein [Chloroflexota bacterium]